MSSGVAVSSLTRAALDAGSKDYLRKDQDGGGTIHRPGHPAPHRFDIGRNTDGFSPLVDRALRSPELSGLLAGSLRHYPEKHPPGLRRLLAAPHGVPPDWLLFGAGLEQLIDQISRALLEPGARVLLPVPNFDPFETFSRRMGAEVDPLHPPGLRWDRAVTREAAERLRHGRFRLLWLSNPVNPTGQHIPVAEIGRMVKAARLAGTAVVVDEAYGEYTDRPEGVVSASRFLAEAPNLLVLRTFSKAHCLPGGRVGYLLCASGGLRKAVDAYRPMFPAPWISLHLAKLAASDPDHATRAREMAAGRRTRFLANASRLPGFQFLASDTNTIMFRHHQADADTLHAALAARGFLTANLNSLTGIQGHNWLRLTLHRDELNDAFLQACRKAVQYLG